MALGIRRSRRCALLPGGPLALQVCMVGGIALLVVQPLVQLVGDLGSSYLHASLTAQQGIRLSMDAMRPLGKITL